MRTHFTPLRIAAVAVLSGLGYTATGQVKIGNNPTVIDPSSVLELENPNKALYLTRVSLSSTTDVTTVPNPKAGMVVYNTNAAIGSGNTSFPASGTGVYYYDGNGWVFSGIGTLGNNFWSLNGNTNATDGVNFLGTVNPQALNFRVNNQKAGRISLTSEGNTTFGALAGDQASTLVTGSNNTLIGTEAGSGVTSGKDNTALGYRALQNVQNGSRNTGVGYRAGGVGVGDSANTFLGYEADVTAPGLGVDSATAIGVGAKVSQTNAVILGNRTAQVGVGVTAPNSKLHVAGNTVGGFPFGTNIFYTGIYSRPNRLNIAGNEISYGVLSHTNADGTGTYNAVAGRILRTGDTSAANLTAALGHVNNPQNFQTAVLGITNSRANQSGDGQVFSGLRVTSTIDTTALNATQKANTFAIYSTSPSPSTVSGRVGLGTVTAPTNQLHVGSAANPLRLEGLQVGANADSLLSVDAATGVVRRVAINTTGAVTTASNGLTKTGNDIALGGTLNQNTTIVTAGNNLNITGTGDLLVDDSIKAGRLGVTGNAAIGGNANIAGNTTTGTLNAGNTSIAGTLGATGATTLGSTLNVAGNTTVTTLTATNLPVGTVNDSLVTIQGNVVRRVPRSSITDVIRANNGLTRDGDSIELGGTLNQNTTIVTAGNNLNITGTGDLLVDDSIKAGRLGVTGNAAIGGNANIAGNTTTSTLNSGNASVAGTLGVTGLATTAGINNTGTLNNTGALNVLGSNATTLSGTLGVTGNTTLTTLTATALPAGASTDSIVTVNASGVVRKASLNTVGGLTTASNGLTKVGNDIRLGGTLTQNTTITSAGNDVNLTGTGNLNVDDTVRAGRLLGTNATVTGNTTTGTLNAGNTSIAGTLGATGATTLGSTLNVTGTTTLSNVPAGAATDSILTQDPATGLVRRVAINTTGAITTASNGLTKVGNDVRLGGTLTGTTNIDNGTFFVNLNGIGGGLNVSNQLNALNAQINNNLSVSNQLSVMGSAIVNGGVTAGSFTTIGNTNTGRIYLTNSLPSTSTTDSLLNFDASTKEVKKVAVSTVLSNIRANNGLTRVADSIQLGGPLTKPTAIGTSAANTIAITGLLAGTAADSIVVVDQTTGVLRRSSLNTLGGVTTASNGLTKVGNDIRLGGTLTQNTTITSAGNDVNLTGTGNLNVDDTVRAGRLLGTNATVTGNTTTGTLNAGTSALGNTTVSGTLGATGLATLSGGAVISSGATVNGGSTLNGGITATGLPTGTLADTVLTIQGNVVRRVPRQDITGVIRASNGLTRDGDTIELGGTLNQATTITQNGNQLNLNGGTVAISDSLNAGRARVNNNLVVGGNTNTGTLNAGNTSIAGTLGATGATTLGSTLNVTGNTTVTTLTATGLGAGSLNDSLVTIEPGTNVVRRIARTSVTGVIRASNGLTRDGDSIELGGTLNQPTTITQAGNQLNFNGGTVAISDSLNAGRARVNTNLVVGGNTNTGTLNAGVSSLGATTVSGTLGVTGATTLQSTLGVTGNTTITTLTATGLPAGTVNDTVVTIQGNVVRRVPRQTITDVIRASNGLTRDGDTIELGGTLNQATTITQNGNQLNLNGGTVAISDSLNAGRARVNTNLSVGSNATVGGTLGVTGAATLNNGLTVNNAASTFNSSVNMPALATGTLNDSVLVATPGTGLVRRISPSTITNVIRANNGLTRVGDTIKLGGALTQPTNIATVPGNDLTISGTGLTNVNTQLNTNNVATTGNITVTGFVAAQGQVSGNSFFSTGNANIGSLTNQGSTLLLSTPTTADSSLNVLNITPAGLVQQVDPRRFTNVIRANNGLTRLADSIQLGGPLTKPTTVTASAANTLAIAGLQGGTISDSLVVADGTTGVLRRRALNNVVTASNGLNAVNGDVRLGGTLNTATTIVATGANSLTIAGTGGLRADTLQALDTATIGRLRVLNNANVDGNTSLAGTLGVTGLSTLSGGAVVNGGSTLNGGITATGLPAGTLADTVLTIQGNVVRRVPRQDITGVIRANNGLNRDADSIQLGGPLTEPTTITTTATNTLSLAGLATGTVGNDVLTIDGNVVRRVTRATITDVIRANNGLTRDGDSIELGGTLNQNTTINTGGFDLTLTNTGNLVVGDSVVAGNFITAGNVRAGGSLNVAGSSTLSGGATISNGTGTGLTVSNGSVLNNGVRVTGLPSGTLLDSIVVAIPTAGATEGTLRRISPAVITNVIRANNGLTRNVDSIQLGGTLTKQTTVLANGTNTLRIAGTGGLVADTLTGVDSASIARLNVTGNASVTGTLGVTGNTTLTTLTATGLPAGTVNDTVVTIQGNVVRRVPRQTITDVIRASNGLNRDGDSIELGGTLNQNTTIDGGQFGLTIQGNRTAINYLGVGTQVLMRNRTAPNGANAAVASVSATEDTSTSGFRQAWGAYNTASTANSDAQVVANYNEAASQGATLTPGTKIIGSVGVANAFGNGSGSTTRVIGSRGYASIAGSAKSFGAIGVDGFVDATDGANPNSVTVGGHFDGTSGGTQFGIIGQVQGLTSYDVMNSPAMTGMKIGVAAVNVAGANAPSSLALYTEGNVRMRRLLDTASVDTVLGLRSNTGGDVRRISTRSILNQLRVGNGLTKVGTDSIRLGGTLQSNTSINTAGFDFNLGGGGTINLSNSTNIGGVGATTAITGNLTQTNGSNTLGGNLTVNGTTVTLTSLNGAGTRMVVADPTGVLSTQTIPTVPVILSGNSNLAVASTLPANSQFETPNISVPGAAVSDVVSVGLPGPYGVGGDVYGYVVSPGNVRIVFSNNSGAGVTFPAGDYRIRVIK